MRRLLPRLLALVPAVMVSTGVEAVSWYNGEFSADIVMTNPKDPAQKAQGKIYVGKTQVRAEGSHEGQLKAVIIDTTSRQAWTLLPDRKAYHAGLGNAPMPPKPDIDPMPNDPDNPCKQPSSGLSCKLLGNEAVGSVNAEKWEVTLAPQKAGGAPRQMTLVLDPQRRVILRQQVAGGPSMERKLVGRESVSGRDTEKWEIVNSFQDQSFKMTQWVDAKLLVPVKISGDQQGFAAEVVNIVEAPQPAKLFEIPKDFKQMEPPGSEGRPGAPPQQGGQMPPQQGGQMPPQQGGQMPPQQGGQMPPQQGGQPPR